MNDSIAVRHILAPVDLGDASRSALRYVRFLAKSSGARVTLFYADAGYTLQSYDHIVAGRYDLDPEEASLLEASVREYADPFFDGVPYEVIVAAADPSRAIPRIAREIGADLIIMGTHGRKGLARAISGSVADSVIRIADRPVVAVPALS